MCHLGSLLLWLIIMTKSKLVRKGLILLILPYRYSSSKAVRVGTQAGQEPRGRSWCRGRGGVLPNDLFLMTCSACCLIKPRTTSPWEAPPTVGGAFPNPSLTKKVPNRFSYFLSWAQSATVWMLRPRQLYLMCTHINPTDLRWTVRLQESLMPQTSAYFCILPNSQLKSVFNVWLVQDC